MSDDAAQLALDHLAELGLTEGVDFEVMPCDPDLADTAAFCAAYGISPGESVNTIVVVGKGDPPVHVACLVLATTRLDVNGVVRKRLRDTHGVRKASFASAEVTAELTGMLIGGVTAFGLPRDMAVWVDSRVLELDRVVLGGGSRSCKIVGSPQILSAHPMVEVVTDLAVAVEPTAGG